MEFTQDDAIEFVTNELSFRKPLKLLGHNKNDHLLNIYCARCCGWIDENPGYRSFNYCPYCGQAFDWNQDK